MRAIQRVRPLLGAFVSLISLGLAFKDVKLVEVLELLARTDLSLLTLAIAVGMAGMGATVIRWKVLFYPFQPTLSSLFSAFMVGLLLNSVFPAKMGTLTRAYLAGVRAEVSKVLALTTIVVEKILDSLLLVFILIGLLLFTSVPQWLLQSGLTTAAIFVSSILLAGLLVRQQDRVLRLSSRLIDRFPILRRLHAHRAVSVIDGLRVLFTKGTIVKLLAWSFVVLAAGVLVNYLVLLVLDIDVPFLAAVILLVVLQIGTRLPSSPGNIGIFQYLCVLTLSIFSVDKSTALGYGLLLHFVVLLFPCLVGAFCLWRDNCTVRELQAEMTPST
jgi:uncharacterized protein (TIRG00374 family)